MILPQFEYRRARSVADAVALYKKEKGKALYLAGGTDLIPLVKLRLQAPKAVIDLKGIEDLRIIASRGGSLSVGANVTLFDLKKDPVIAAHFPVLIESLEATACETLQMRGTLGGNILQGTRCLEYNQSLEWRKARGFCLKTGGRECNVVRGAKTCFANYCSDNAPSLISLGAQLRFTGPGGERTVKLESLFTGDARTPFAMEGGEVLTHILIPLKKTKGAYEKLRVRESMDYPLVGAAVSVIDGKARVCVGGVGGAPRLYVIGDIRDAAAVMDVAEKASADAKPVANATVSPVYRKKMVGTLVKRAVRRALAEGKR